MNSLGTVRYLDPGTGSMLIQYLAGAVLAAILVLKTYFKKIKREAQKAMNRI